MKLSIFTPTHNPALLDRAYESLKDQSYQNWEWVIILNSNCPAVYILDDRVKIFRYEEGSNVVGALKKFACEKCTGEVLVELDHDDMLMPDCLEELRNAFSDKTIDFAYSDCASVNSDWSPVTWNEIHGWRYNQVEYKGHRILSAIASDPHPQSISRIWFAPNHVRAWGTEFYHKIGGHDTTMVISDDHDLMLRTYISGKMHHIKKCLYVYWVDGNNTWLKYQNDIQITQWDCYNKYIKQLSEKWARVNNLKAIDIGGAINCPSGYISVDRQNADVVTNLNESWPFEDNSVGIIRAYDVIEHLKDPIHTMNEAWRVLAHGGFFFIEVPSTDGKGAWCDPTHVSFWNDRSFRYYTEANMRKYIEPECYCRFFSVKTENIIQYDGVPYVRTHLIATKEGGFKIFGHQRI